jgi:TIR domain
MSSATPTNSPLVFISYAREDKHRIIRLGRALRSSGLRTWIDVENIVPGERWEAAVEKALRQADFILVCISTHSVSKRGFAQREIKRALHAEEEMLADDIFLVPVLLDSSEIPFALQPFQWVDATSNAGFAAVTAAIKAGAQRRGLLTVGQDEDQAGTKDERSQVDLSALGGAGFLEKFRRRRDKTT